MNRLNATILALLMITVPLSGCIGDKDKIDDGGIAADDEKEVLDDWKEDCEIWEYWNPDLIDESLPGNGCPHHPDAENKDNETIVSDFVGSVVFETPGEAVLSGVSVPFIYYEEATYYLYMCNGTEGHHYSTSSDGLNFSSPLRTGIGGCGLNFVKLNDGTYRLYTTTKVTLENGTESINSTSAIFTNLTDIGPTNRVSDNGTNAQSTGEPCNDFMGTPSVVRLNESDDSVRLYFSCSEPSHMAGFTSADGINFGTSDGILLYQAIDIEIHDIGDGYRVFYTMMNPDVHPEITPFHPQEIMTAVSDDGLNWTVEGMIANVTTVAEGLEMEIGVLADPSAVLLEDGSWRIFFGSASEKTDNHGGIYSLRWTP